MVAVLYLIGSAASATSAQLFGVLRVVSSPCGTHALMGLWAIDLEQNQRTLGLPSTVSYRMCRVNKQNPGRGRRIITTTYPDRCYL
ncbi:hypothetical protein EDB84DRAFT_1496956 [Lactarius hengduanensis]|nr:hypothetical protein EDB84DRAFT_1496956 [Lactarius hengduanensis]